MLLKHYIEALGYSFDVLLREYVRYIYIYIYICTHTHINNCVCYLSLYSATVNTRTHHYHTHFPLAPTATRTAHPVTWRQTSLRGRSWRPVAPLVLGGGAALCAAPGKETTVVDAWSVVCSKWSLQLVFWCILSYGCRYNWALSL